jgi:hypothetical protein
MAALRQRSTTGLFREARSGRLLNFF